MDSILKFFFILFSATFFAQSKANVDSLIVKGVKAMNNKEFSLSLELLTKANSIAEENRLYKQQFLAINNIGANYYSMLDYGEALNNYLNAYTIALKHLDEHEEMIILNNIAILYSKEEEFKKAEEYFTKAYNLSKENNETIKTGLYAINLGIVTNQQNKLDVALDYLNKAEEIFKEKPSLLILVKTALADNFYRRKKYLKAKEILNKTLPNLNDIQFSEEKISSLILMSTIFKETGKTSQAIKYATTALESSLNIENKISSYNQLAEIYKESKLINKAIEAKDSVIALNNYLNKIKNGRLFETNKVKFEIENYKQQLKQNQKKHEEERIIFYGLLALLAIIICLVTWALRNSFIKNKQRKILHLKDKEIIELELQKKNSNNLILEKQLRTKEALALLEQERLKNEIEKRNQKLATKALQTSARNEILKEIINSLYSQTEVTNNQFLSKKIVELKTLLKSDNEWESFFTHFEQVNHNFITELKKRHPELTANDIRYISYLYMNLTNKEISSLFNITPEASRKRKERIANKIGLTTNQNLYDYISNI
ncbi:tetratricopeptide repeat protein [Polaribacter sargassicola]|uniref:tetratricopeptide repeat protein n=1 Tax=Polaribacter sargassicola TaxID=2836891 RepID=UPI001F213648|nr:tetratricopeptide repeat protein [Polaribacter sp. DS7-9]MCG1036446.1 tetratricopeptide repeat protein [Polaribacter sp. DS7-9]